MINKDKTKQVKAEIRLVVPTELTEGRYANYAAVTHSPHEFHIFFAQVGIPTEQESAVKSLEARAVAHLLIAPSVIDQFIKALQTNYNRYKKDIKEIRELEKK